MADLRIKDLVVEYSSGGYAVRPIDGLNIEVTAGSLALLAYRNDARDNQAGGKSPASAPALARAQGDELTGLV